MFRCPVQLAYTIGKKYCLGDFLFRHYKKVSKPKLYRVLKYFKKGKLTLTVGLGMNQYQDGQNDLHFLQKWLQLWSLKLLNCCYRLKWHWNSYIATNLMSIWTCDHFSLFKSLGFSKSVHRTRFLSLFISKWNVKFERFKCRKFFYYNLEIFYAIKPLNVITSTEFDFSLNYQIIKSLGILLMDFLYYVLIQWRN